MSFVSIPSPRTCSKLHWFDRLGVGMALLCAVHCLLTPILVALLPIIASSFWVDENFHIWMLFLVIPLTTFSFYIGCRKHHDIFLVVLAVLALGLLFSAVIFGCSTCSGGHSLFQIPDFRKFPHGFESILTTLGGSLLVLAHIRNYRLCRKTDCNHDH